MYLTRKGLELHKKIFKQKPVIVILFFILLIVSLGLAMMMKLIELYQDI